MKLNSFPAALAILVATLVPLPGAGAAPLVATTAVQARPDPAAPVITYLKAGTEPVPAAADSGPLPAGWMAVEIAGPFEAYVLNRDLTKSLDVKPGSSLYLMPQEGAGVLAVVAAGDKTEITGLRGKWTRISLKKDLVGYIQSDSATAPGPGEPPSSPAAGAPGAMADASGSASGPAPSAAGKPAAGFGVDDGGASHFPRLLEGQFVSTHNLLPLHRPYDWQLVDDSGNRRAYLDVSKLLQTDQIDRYVNRAVEVSGTMTALPNGEIVVAVESLQLK